MAAVDIKRVYEPAAPEDGLRILVDRIWPRGMRKEAAALDYWLKDIAPSTELRKWFDHRPERWSEFKRKYLAELAKNPAAKEARDLTKKRHVTLLYSAHDMEHNQALVLAAYLRKANQRETTKAPPKSKPRARSKVAGKTRK